MLFVSSEATQLKIAMSLLWVGMKFHLGATSRRGRDTSMSFGCGMKKLEA